MTKSLLTFSADFNRPESAEGVRYASIRGPEAERAYINGWINTGDIAVAYFDPEEGSAYGLFGWSALVRIVKAEPFESNEDRFRLMLSFTEVDTASITE